MTKKKAKKLTLLQRVKNIEFRQEADFRGVREQKELFESHRDNADKRYIDLKARVTLAEVVDGPFWKTADGTVLRMKEMKDSHLDNAICFLEKKEGKDNGDLWRAKWIPKLKELRAEKKRRATLKANDEKWTHLHNGTGPYAISTKEEQPGTSAHWRYVATQHEKTILFLRDEIAKQKAEISRLRQGTLLDAEGQSLLRRAVQLANCRAWNSLTGKTLKELLNRLACFL